MVVHLVGLGGSLEGRVAGVVLELVGCEGEISGQLWCSCSACTHPLPLVFMFHSCPHPISMLFLVHRAPVLPNDREDENVLAARVVASELMPYAMTRPVIETALALLSLS